MTTGTPTTATTATTAAEEQGGDGDFIDPLDSYMASIASEVTHQAPLATVANAQPQPQPTPTASPSQLPSLAQLAVAKKVAVSPFCDVLLRGKGERLWSSGGGSGSGVDANLNGVRHSSGGGGEAEQACLGLLLAQPAEFLRCYGHILSPADLESFLPTEDSGVSVHVARLRTLISQRQRQQHQQHQHPRITAGDADDIDMTPVGTSAAAAAAASAAAPPPLPPPPVGWGHDRGYLARPCPPDGARVRNRRYRRLQQLAEGGVWFSDEAMKERDPWLWFEYVGKRAGEEKPAPKLAVEEVPGSTSVGTYLQESLGFLSQQQKGEWPTGVPNTAAAGAGSSLGMAFLSGMSEGGGGVGACFAQSVVAMDTTAEERQPRDIRPVDVAAGATVDISYLPASPPAAASTLPSQGDDDGDNSTAAVTAAVEAVGLRDRGGEGEGGGGGEGGGVVAEETHRVRVRFVDQEGVVLEEEEEQEEEEGEGEGEEEEEDDDMEGGVRAGGREEIARILSERFLAGEEEGVDYKDVDGDERLDDLDQLARDEEDRWFRGEEDRAASMED